MRTGFVFIVASLAAFQGSLQACTHDFHYLKW